MKEFISSPDFLWWVIGGVVLAIVVVALRRNTVWEARGITPTEDVEKLRTRILGMFPKTTKGWSILAGAIVAILIVFSLSSTGPVGTTTSTASPAWEAPSLARVTELSREYWHLIALAFVVGYIGLSFIPNEHKEVGDKLKPILIWAIPVLFIVVPVLDWGKDLFVPQIICKDASAYETRDCNLNTAWSTWIKFAEGPAANGMRLCISPGAKFEREEMNETTFWHFKAEKGRLLMQYRLFPGNEKCPDVL